MPAMTHDAIKIGGDFDELKKMGLALSFYGSKGALNRMLNLAALNAARTFVPKLKAEAPGPGGGQGYATGRLRNAIKARKAKYNWPGAVVGIKAGETRQDKSGAWYRWMYVSPSMAHPIMPRYRGVKAIKTKYGYFAKVQHPGWRGNNFVDRVTDQNPENVKISLEAFNASVESSLNNGTFRDTIMRYKRR